MDSKFLKSAKFLGLEMSGRSGPERICTCPACGKEKHFYWNEEKGVGHCKVCNVGLSKMPLLEALLASVRADLTPTRLHELAADRELPVEAFEGHEIGYRGGWYVLSVHGLDGRLSSVRRYRVWESIITLDGCHAALFGAERLGDEQRRKEPVYICEGEWDAIALEWLRRKVQKDGVVVAVPGAAIFKEDWCHWFRNRSVYLVYDNDEAGQNGMNRAVRLLEGYAESIHTIQWEEGQPKGYDVRDLIVSQKKAGETES